jgi:hypothetical protein
MVTLKSIEIKKVGSGSGQLDNITQEEGTSGTDNATDDNNGWTMIDNETAQIPPFDLLVVKNTPLTLSSLNPVAGNYKVRLEVESVKITFANGDKKAATVPSGKIKFSSAFEVTKDQDQITVVLLDFDAARSVNVTGNDKVMFKPVVKLTVSHENKGQPKNNDLYITTNKLPGGTVNTAYDNTTLKAVGGSGDYNWEVISGSLPENLTLNEDTGLISGIPSPAGTYSITVQVTDGSTPAKTATREFTLVIKTATP